MVSYKVKLVIFCLYQSGLCKIISAVITLEILFLGRYNKFKTTKGTILVQNVVKHFEYLPSSLNRVTQVGLEPNAHMCRCLQ